MSSDHMRNEFAHLPEDNPLWQESVALTWYDVQCGVGGFLRIGQEPAHDSQNLVVGVITAQGLRFRRFLPSIPLQPTDRSQEHFAAESFSITRDGVHLRFAFDDSEAALDLTFRDFHEPTAFDTAMASGGHIECAGSVVGTVDIGEHRFEVDALAVRDHSWGLRDYGRVVNHRWCAGSFGPAFSWTASVLHLADGSVQTAGILHLDGKPEICATVDLVAGIESDGVSVRNGTCRLTRPSGEEFFIVCEAVDGVAATFGDGKVFVVDAICEASCGDLRGFADFEASNNPRRGIAVPSGASGCVDSDGVSRRDRT